MSSPLDDSINQAQQAQRKRRFWSVLGAVLIVLAAGLFVGLKRTSHSIDLASESPDLSVSSHPQVVDVSRDDVQIFLNQASQSYQALGQNAELASWNVARVEDVKRELDKAYNLYAQQDYPQALNLAQWVLNALEAYETEFQHAYENNFQNALKAFSDNNIDQARKFNEAALALNSQYSEALELQRRLNVANQVKTLEQALDIARVENNRDAQIRILSEIIQLDPTKVDTAQQLRELQTQKNDEIFAAHFSAANQALEAGDVNTAKQELTKLKQIAPTRHEITLLSNQINNHINQRSESEYEQQITLFIQSDEWPTVSLLAEKGLKQFPNNALIQQALQSARSVASANQTFDGFIDNSARLRDENIRARAEEAIATAELELAISDKLAVKSEQLLALITAENQPVSVQITSDNKTMLKVLGVGVVGKVKQKTIQLKPGNYKVEGVRDGFKTVIVELIVSPQQQSIQIEVVCHERI